MEVPVKIGKDKKGSYFQWGKQKKYYFNPKDKESKEEAKEKAVRQGKKIYVEGYDGE